MVARWLRQDSLIKESEGSIGASKRCADTLRILRFVESGKMLSGKTGELEHGDFSFAHDNFKLSVTKNIALVGRILQVVRLDVVPQLLHNFGARQRSGANDRGKLSAGF